MVMFLNNKKNPCGWFQLAIWMLWLFYSPSGLAQESYGTQVTGNTEGKNIPSQTSSPATGCSQTPLLASEIEIVKYVPDDGRFVERTSGVRQHENLSIYRKIYEVRDRYQGRLLSWEQQNNFINEITFLYIQNNFITSRAECRVQNAESGKLTIQLVEGFIGEIIIEKDTEYQLSLVSLEDLDFLPEEGDSLVVLASINDSYHVRIFDATGQIVVDTGEGEFSPDTILLRKLNQVFDGKPLNETDNELIRGIISVLGPVDGINACPEEGYEPNVYFEAYIRDYLEDSISTPLSIKNLEEHVNVLARDPKFESIQIALESGDRLGESTLLVKVVEQRDCPSPNDSESVGIDFKLNNYSSPSVGTYRLGLGITTPGPFDLIDFPYIYDELSVVAETNPFSFSTDTSRNIGISYRVPLERGESAFLGVSYEDSRNKVIEPALEKLGLRANSERLSFQYNQAIVRSPLQDFSLLLGLSVENNQTFAFDNIPVRFSEGPSASGTSRSSIITFGQNYARRGRRSQFLLASQFNLGTGLFDATQNAEPIPDGQFFSWNLQLQWLQRLSEGNLLAISGESQLASDSLLPMNRFAVGGGSSVRGYSQNLLSGDNGFRLSIEDYIQLSRSENSPRSLFLIPFVDIGGVWNSDSNSNILNGNKTIFSVGSGLEWISDSNFKTRIDFGVPLVYVEGTGNSLQESGFTFQIEYGLDLF